MKGSGLVLLLAAGILAQPTTIREIGTREEFQGALNLVDKGRAKEAVVAFRTFVERHPDVSEAWNNLATLEAAMGDLDAARISLRKALDCQQASQVALRNLDKVVGRMARAAWDSALSSTSASDKQGPKLDLVRELPLQADTNAVRKEADSLKSSILRFARERDSLMKLRKSQNSILDSIRRELGNRQAMLDRMVKRRSEDSTKAEDLRASYRMLLRRSDSLDGVLKSRGRETESLRGMLAQRTREADSLRKVITRREAEGDSLRRTLARVEQERLDAQREARRKASEVSRVIAESDGARMAIATSDAPRIGEATLDPIATVLAWAEAWSRRDAEGYLAFYSDEFSPKDGRAAWEALRRSRIGIDDSIHVQVSDPRIEKLSSGKVAVTFRQSYEAGETKLKTRKRIVLRREVPGWKILQEDGGSR